MKLGGRFYEVWSECRIRSSRLAEFVGKGEGQANRLDSHYISDATPEDIAQAGINTNAIGI